MRTIDHSFYETKIWHDCRIAYIRLHPLCERCSQKGLIVPAEIVHHRIHLNPSNVTNADIAYGFNNLESLCRSCHNQEHFGSQYDKRWNFDESGNLIFVGE